MVTLLKKLVPLSIKQRVWKYQSSREEQRLTREEQRLRRQLFGVDEPLIPSTSAMFDGPQSYEAFKTNGEEFLKIYREYCGLGRDEIMLDVGCGIGRKTLPLTHYFGREATYHGIDPTMAGIDWCRTHLTPKYPNFHFQWMDVYNQLYNPTGKTAAAQYRFPFEDGTFTFIMLGSVFTHMIPAEIDRYLSEIHRVLKPGGRCFISYFLLNTESRPLILAKKSAQPLPYSFGDCLVADAEKPEIAIAHPEEAVRERYKSVGLIVDRIGFGSWCGRRDHLSYQDLILAHKPS